MSTQIEPTVEEPVATQEETAATIPFFALRRATASPPTGPIRRN